MKTLIDIERRNIRHRSLTEGDSWRKKSLKN